MEQEDARRGELRPGDQVGRYRVLEPLGHGGMAEIYLASAAGIGGFEKRVVIKRMPSYFAEREELVEMFLDEARLTAGLHHPNVPQVYDVGRSHESWFFAMEYVDGVDLRRVLRASERRGEPVPLGAALAIAMGTAAALDAAHEHRSADGSRCDIVHRDVSPSNILVTFDGCVKLIDFGIAKATPGRADTEDGIIKGKWGYMSPEQCRGEEIDRRTDLFSLGIVLYELTTGMRLYGGRNNHEVMEQRLTREIPAPSSSVPGYPPALERIVCRALEPDRERRTPTARQLYMDLDRFARWQGLQLSPYALSGYVAGLFRDDPRAPTRADTFILLELATPAVRPAAPRARWRVLGGASALVAIAALAWLATSALLSISPVAAPAPRAAATRQPSLPAAPAAPVVVERAVIPSQPPADDARPAPPPRPQQTTRQARPRRRAARARGDHQRERTFATAAPAREPEAASEPAAAGEPETAAPVEPADAGPAIPAL